MSGGMGSGRGRGPSLAERAALSRGAQAPVETGGGTSDGAAREQSTAREPSGRHCWVLDPPEAPGRWPGLLAEWRRAPDGLWEGRVVYAVPVRDRCVLVEAWLGVHRLEQG